MTMTLAAVVRAEFISTPRDFSKANTEYVAKASKPPTHNVRHISGFVKIGSSGSRGGRLMVSNSFGSNASVAPSNTAVDILIHRICSGVIGN